MYGKPDCPLCDKALLAVADSGIGERFSVKVVNIEEDPELFDLYRWEIPVLVLQGREVVKGIVTVERLLEKLRDELRDMDAPR